MSSLLRVGWREWLSLPDLAVPWIKVKVDTGARTSAMNAQNIDIFQRHDAEWVRFQLTLFPGTNDNAVLCEAPVTEYREVTDSGGNTERRPVIRSSAVAGSFANVIDITLTDRSTMRFSMLLGRTALPKEAAVLPRRSFLLGGDRYHPPETL